MNNEAFQAQVLEKLEAQGHLLASLVQAVSDQQPQLEMANARLEEIVELLPKTGPSLAETLADLANRIERQTAVIRDLTKVVVEAADA